MSSAAAVGSPQRNPAKPIRSWADLGDLNPYYRAKRAKDEAAKKAEQAREEEENGDESTAEATVSADADPYYFDSIVPVRLELDNGIHKLRECLLWDLKDSDEAICAYAVCAVHDWNLPKSFESAIAQSIRSQIRRMRHACARLNQLIRAGNEFIVPVTIDIRLRDLQYEDKFDWDVSSRHVTPEEFASHTVVDLQMPPEMKPMIAHAIRECFYEKLHEQTSSSSSRGRKRARTVIRDDRESEEWAPVIEQLDVHVLDKRQNKEERELRYRRRQLGLDAVSFQSLPKNSTFYGVQGSLVRPISYGVPLIHLDEFQKRQKDAARATGTTPAVRKPIVGSDRAVYNGMDYRVCNAMRAKLNRSN